LSTIALSALTFPLRGLDWLRLLWLRALGPLAKPLVRSRELRIAVFGASSLLVAFALTGFFPLFLLAIGPLVLGIPHVMSDLRYMVFRPGLHRRWWLVVPAVGLFAAQMWTFDARFGIGVTLLGILAARGKNHGRRALALALALGWMALAVWSSRMTALVFAHFHNFVAIAIFWAWRRNRSSPLHFVPIVLFLSLAAVIAAGGLDGLVTAMRGYEGTVGRTGIAWNLALYSPGVPAPWGARLVLLFAFAQSAHYAVWLRLLPEDDRRQETPRTWAASFEALRKDMGPVLAIVLGLLALSVSIWAIVDLYEARMGYLRMVLFHGYLEMAALALLFVEGAPLRVLDAVPASEPVDVPDVDAGALRS
jgi:hypothetical protein